jgi:hypothetical protein
MNDRRPEGFDAAAWRRAGVALAVLLAAAIVGIVVWSQRDATQRAEAPPTPPPAAAARAAEAAPADAAPSAARSGSAVRPRAAGAPPAAPDDAATTAADAASAPPAETTTVGPPTVPTPEGRATIAEVRADARSAAAERAEAQARARTEAAVAAVATSPEPSDPLADVLAALQRGSGPHRWQWGTADPRADGAASRQWLADVQRAAGSRWKPQAEVALTGQALVLSNELGVVGRLELVEGGVLWYPGAAPRLGWRADLPPETVQRLRGALAAWAG